MERVTIELSDATLNSLDSVAQLEHGGDRNEAVQQLLDEWLAQQP